MSESGIIGQAYGRKIHAREVVAIDEAGDGLCWVRLTRFGDDWLLIRSDARDVSRAVRKLRQIPAGEQSGACGTDAGVGWARSPGPGPRPTGRCGCPRPRSRRGSPPRRRVPRRVGEQVVEHLTDALADRPSPAAGRAEGRRRRRRTVLSGGGAMGAGLRHRLSGGWGLPCQWSLVCFQASQQLAATGGGTLACLASHGPFGAVTPDDWR